MRVAAQSPEALQVRAASSERATREVEPKKTPLTTSEIRGALSLAYQKRHGQAAPAKLLDVLTAQVSTETASGASMHNFNFGGIKGTSPQGLTARTMTREILDGREVRIKDGFRAYKSPIEGAVDYLGFLEKRFPRAIEAAKSGDVTEYVSRLKAGRYFTADETQYAQAVRGHMAASSGIEARFPSGGASDATANVDRVLDGFVAPPPGEAFATVAAVTRVLDAMSASSVAIARPLEDES